MSEARRYVVGDVTVVEQDGHRMWASPCHPPGCSCDWRTGQNASGDWGWLRHAIRLTCTMHRPGKVALCWRLPTGDDGEPIHPLLAVQVWRRLARRFPGLSFWLEVDGEVVK